MIYNGLPNKCFVNAEEEYLRILSWLIEAYEYREILEIGTFQGHSAKVWDRCAERVGGHVTTVDLTVQHFDRKAFKRTMFVHLSSDAFFSGLPKDKRFDFIFVDGDHAFEQARKDIGAATEVLAEGGAIAIHDTVYLSDVQRAVNHWKENLKGAYWMDFPLGKGLCICWPKGEI